MTSSVYRRIDVRAKLLKRGVIGISSTGACPSIKTRVADDQPLSPSRYVAARIPVDAPTGDGRGRGACVPPPRPNTSGRGLTPDRTYRSSSRLTESSRAETHLSDRNDPLSK